MPKVSVIRHSEMLRHDVANQLNGQNNVGIELGVAEGVFSKRMVASSKFRIFYGVDLYGDTHDTAEYIRALNYIGVDEQVYKLLRIDFDSALQVFPDDFFDFIYIDGYAHTGEEGGRTLVDWFPKLKNGGILAGDDYHDDWPLVKWAVNNFAQQAGSQLNMTGQNESAKWCHYPTWFLKKNAQSKSIQLDPHLYSIATTERARIHMERSKKKRSWMKKLGLRSALSRVWRSLGKVR